MISRTISSFCMAWLLGTAILLSPLPLSATEECNPMIIDLCLGEPIPFDEMLDDLAKMRVVYAGEFHTIARHHKLQMDILDGLTKRDVKLALGMEMFDEQDQPVLDRWLASKDGLSKLIADLGKGHWTNLPDYGPLLIFARGKGIPVVGLNADASLVRKVARGGVEALDATEKERLPEDMGKMSPLNDRLLRLRLRVHKALAGKSLDNIVLAQRLRDETMARTVVRFFDSPSGADRTMVVIAGNAHMNFGFGIPEGVSRRKELPHRIVLASESGELVLSEEEKRMAAPVETSHEDLRFLSARIADYLQVAPLKDEGKEPTFGVAAVQPADRVSRRQGRR